MADDSGLFSMKLTMIAAWFAATRQIAHDQGLELMVLFGLLIKCRQYSCRNYTTVADGFAKKESFRRCAILRYATYVLRAPSSQTKCQQSSVVIQRFMTTTPLALYSCMAMSFHLQYRIQLFRQRHVVVGVIRLCLADFGEKLNLRLGIRASSFF